MAGTNEILTFAQGGAANVIPQTEYATLGSRTNGFQSGVAQSNQLNKVWRQAAFMARVLSQWAIDTTGGSILDNGDEANAKALLSSAVQTICNAILTLNNYVGRPEYLAGIASLNTIIGNEDLLWRQAVAAEGQTRSQVDAAEASARASADTTEANTRFQQDQNIVAALAGYMQKGTSRASWARLVSATTVTSLNRLDLNFTLTVASNVLVLASVNVSTGLQPTGGGLSLYIDAVLLAPESTQGPMTLTYAIALAAGAHVATVFYFPGSTALNQIGLNLSYITVPA